MLSLCDRLATKRAVVDFVGAASATREVAAGAEDRVHVSVHTHSAEQLVLKAFQRQLNGLQ